MLNVLKLFFFMTELSEKKTIDECPCILIAGNVNVFVDTE